MKSTLRTALIGGITPSSLAADVTLTLSRIGFGLLLAFGHGIGKVPPKEGFIDGVENLGFPLPVVFAWAAGLTEFFGGLLMAIGLFTRPAAFFIICTMLVAAFMRHWDDPLFATDADPCEGVGSKEMALLFLCGALVYLGAGSGRIGIDTYLRKN